MAAHQFGATAVLAGKLSPAQFAALDDQAYAALITVRQVAAAVRAGTASQTDLQAASNGLVNATAQINLTEK